MHWHFVVTGGVALFVIEHTMGSLRLQIARCFDPHYIGIFST
jgi:hypothetical protein